MAVKICDAVMGSGKTESAITYINEHPEDRFIYITPYLNEAARIKRGCPDAHFAEPSNKLGKYNFQKTTHAAALIKSGRNVATTHQAFKHYTEDVLDDIRKWGYTLIVDENVDVLQTFEFHPDDLRVAVDAGLIRDNGGIYSLSDNCQYKGSALREMLALLRSRELVRIPGENDDDLFYWALPPDLFRSFRDVYVLTYLFSGQSLHHFMKIYDIPYEYIGIQRVGNGYRFGPYPGYTPEYIHDLPGKIHILHKSRLNDVGDDHYALSMKWFEQNEVGVERLGKNVSNYYNNIWRDIPADRRLWGSYNGAYNKIKGKGYAKSFLTFNAKSSNAYRDKDCLVYIVNLFMNVREKIFYQMHGIDVDEDKFALSVMIQWIWRSAIRDGGDINIYIPSRRMRDLLEYWIETVSKGGNVVDELAV